MFMETPIKTLEKHMKTIQVTVTVSMCVHVRVDIRVSLCHCPHLPHAVFEVLGLCRAAGSAADRWRHCASNLLLETASDGRQEAVPGTVRYEL